MKLSNRTLEIMGLVVFLTVGVTCTELCPVHAADLRPTINLASKHINPDMEYNEVNLGLGLELRRSEGDSLYLTAGAYHNSVDALSVYMGGGWVGVGPKWAKVGLEAGAVTGYAPGPVPLVTGVVRVADHVKVLVIPPSPQSPLTFGLQVVF